ncbi:MAG TPA: fibronectin type III domain-containing protein [Armatimonadota bacterium]|nr:fibronectin type III domain-containing protein [Armatimonadota bacterium]
MKIKILICGVLAIATICPAQAKGKLAGNAGGWEREVAACSRESGVEGWTITGGNGEFEFSLEPGEYMVSCWHRLAPYVQIRDGETTKLRYAEDPFYNPEREMWTPRCLRFGQTYTAIGNALDCVVIWIAQSQTRLTLALREDGPQGKLVGETTTPEKREWMTTVTADPEKFPTTPGKVYYLELASADGVPWAIGMPRSPDPYARGIAYFDGVPHPESDLGIMIFEIKPGPVRFAAARIDQHYIEKGPGSGWCKVAGQTFVAKNVRNVLSAHVNCGFSGGVKDLVYAIREGGPGGKILGSKTVRMVSNWGSAAYFLPDEVALKPGGKYYLEYRLIDGKPLYSYLSADVYPDGKAYRDGEEVAGFDQFFEIIGEVEPGGVTYPYNIEVGSVTSNSAKISWETGTKADGIVYYGEDPSIARSAVANEDLSTDHSVVLTDLKPGTTYYFRVTSFTRKEYAARTYGHEETFMTLFAAANEDKPSFDRPEPMTPVVEPAPGSVPVVNASFEKGLKGWSRCSSANPEKHKEAKKEYPIGNGPFGDATAGADGYRPHSGRLMYGWRHLAAEDPNPFMPRGDWKHDIIYQRIEVEPGHGYILKAWALTGDRGSAWGRDSRLRLEIDTKDEGLLESVEKSDEALATQWFGMENQWKQMSLHFTAEKDTAVIGIHILQWWALEANYLYVDDVSVEEER